MSELDEFSKLDWDNDQILNNPTSLDFRVDQLLGKIDMDTPSSAASDRLIIDEDYTPSTFSVETPRSTISTETPLSFTGSPEAVPVYQSVEILQPQPPTVLQAPTLQTPKLAASTSNKLTPTVPKIKPVAPAKAVEPPKWERPEDKIRKYRAKQERYYTLREGYLARYKSMKTLIRKQKATNEALPPREETIQLFSEVRPILITLQ